MEALEACDCMALQLRDAEDRFRGWAYIVNEFEQDPEQQIADYSGDFINNF
jgi:hypothetical protein